MRTVIIKNDRSRFERKWDEISDCNDCDRSEEVVDDVVVG